MKKQLVILIMLVLSSSTFAQQASSKFELKLGLGTSFLGTGDMQTLLFENELNYKLNQYFSSSASINFASSIQGSYESTSYVQGNANIFISPFKNIKEHNFRLGTGLSYYRVSDTWQSQVFLENGELVEQTYGFQDRGSFGVNGIMEYSFAITDKLSLGAKAFLQVFRNQDINTGVMFKLGIGL